MRVCRSAWRGVGLVQLYRRCSRTRVSTLCCWRRSSPRCTIESRRSSKTLFDPVKSVACRIHSRTRRLATMPPRRRVRSSNESTRARAQFEPTLTVTLCASSVELLLPPFPEPVYVQPQTPTGTSAMSFGSMGAKPGTTPMLGTPTAAAGGQFGAFGGFGAKTGTTPTLGAAGTATPGAAAGTQFGASPFGAKPLGTPGTAFPQGTTAFGTPTAGATGAQTKPFSTASSPSSSFSRHARR